LISDFKSAIDNRAEGELGEANPKSRIPVEMHIFQKGGHGYGLAPNGGTQSSWPDLCIKWMKQMGIF
jgi:hypothetical protein